MGGGAIWPPSLRGTPKTGSERAGLSSITEMALLRRKQPGNGLKPSLMLPEPKPGATRHPTDGWRGFSLPIENQVGNIAAAHVKVCRSKSCLIDYLYMWWLVIAQFMIQMGSSNSHLNAVVQDHFESSACWCAGYMGWSTPFFSVLARDPPFGFPS